MLLIFMSKLETKALHINFIVIYDWQYDLSKHSLINVDTEEEENKIVHFIKMGNLLHVKDLDIVFSQTKVYSSSFDSSLVGTLH